MRRANPEQMAQWLARWAQCGWNSRETSRRSGHPVWKLRRWQKRRGRTRAAEAPGRVFVALELRDSTPSLPIVLEVTTLAGHRVSVRTGFEPEHLRRVLQALAASCSTWVGRTGGSCA
jgi:hypothetical protein